MTTANKTALHSHAHCGCGHDHTHETHSHANCGCGHDHTHETHSHANCGCGHDHTHETHAHVNCGCGHDHTGNYRQDGTEGGTNSELVLQHRAQHVPGHPADCHCSRCYPHEEYCDVCGESLAQCTCAMPDAGNIKKVYLLENLGCANCAAKMEYKIRELPGVTYANISFVTRQLRLSAANHEALLPEIRRICAAVESDVRVVPRESMPAGGFRTVTYLLANLGCAHCGAKIEQAVAKLPEVETAVLTFATGKLQVTMRGESLTVAAVQQICDNIEEGILVSEHDGSSLAGREMQRAGRRWHMGEAGISLAEIATGGALFIAAEWLGVLPEQYRLPALFIAYFLLGRRIVMAAARSLVKGHALDENFLMTVATLGAFVINAWEEAVGVMLFYRVGEYFEQLAVAKSRSQIMETVDLRPEKVNLLLGDKVQVIDAAAAHVGDILLVRAGERIPLDSVVIEGESLLDTSAITGEPVPVAVRCGDTVLSGCVNTTGMLRLRVEKVLTESMVTRILESVEKAAASKPQIDRFITRFARIYTPVVVGIALLTAVVPSLVTGNWQHWIYTALTFLVISCPCALVLSVPLAFFSGIGAASRQGILFKGGVVIEALRNVSAVVLDKTGTVTRGDFEVQRLLPAEGTDETELLRLCAIAEQASLHPIAASIIRAADSRGLTLQQPESFCEVAGEGLAAVWNGREILCGNRKLLLRYGIDGVPQAEYLSGSEVLVAADGRYLGRIIISDTLKQDAPAAVQALKKQGMAVAMLTGDNEQEARAAARLAGIDEVYARLLPQDKLNRLIRLRDKYGPVMFVGDGINDAPVLAGADVGAAMGSGADAAIEAADVVFMKSGMQAVPQAIAIARHTASVAWQNVFVALAIKGAVMAAGIFGYASMWVAVFADTGVALLCVLNSVRILYGKNK